MKRTLFPLAALLLASSLRLVAADFQKEIRPLLSEFCNKCHSTKDHKGDLDLERFKSLDAVKRDAKVWQQVEEQLELGEMPPKDKPQLSTAQKARLVAWVRGTLGEIAKANAGDPGPVVLRRLSNAEYTYTVRDLTGVAALDPAREFPVDGAAGEGFSNAGAALVMSPALLTKYLDAAKDLAAHAALLPDGLAFSPSTSQRDWTEERLAAIRTFYGRFSEKGGGTAVNLQGIKFDTKDGGILPLEKYLAATLELRATRAGDLQSPPSNERSGAAAASRRHEATAAIIALAKNHGLNAKYLTTLWTALNDSQPSLVLDLIRAQWRDAKPAAAPALAVSIAQWQRALWRFTTVGHIGKRNGPSAWQMPVVPLAASQEVRVKLPAPANGNEVILYLLASDAGDGNENDFAVWENPRLVAPGRPDLRLRDVRDAVLAFQTQRERVAASAAKCLTAADEASALPDRSGVAALAQKHGVEPALLNAWLDYLGIGGGPVRVTSHMTKKLESANNYDFIKGWTGADALSVLANSSDNAVRIPGHMKPHSVGVHPSPKLRVCIGWNSPAAATVRVEAVVQHAHPECGNGVTWSLELRRGSTRQRLAAGTAQGAREVKVPPVENLAVQPGDLLSLVIGPRDGNHSCDMTAVDLDLKATDGKRWNLARDVSPNVLAGNPHADGLGNPGVWHFYSEPDSGGGADSIVPAGSLLAKWRAAADAAEKGRLAESVQKLLASGPANLAKDAPDAVLHRQLTALGGPLFKSQLGSSRREEAPTKPQVSQSLLTSAATWGIDSALFGKHPNGSALPAANLCVRAPSLLEVRLPADLVEGCEFVATATLHRETGAEGSVQMQALTTKPASATGLAAGAAKELGGKSTWSDGERPVGSDTPILVTDGSTARKRTEAALDQFRQLFPAALCYTKIVPVDEVVTLTLYYREDDQLRRLLLDDAQTAELERLWAGLHFVSHSPLKLVDAFEQLWQYATQDADPSAFTPMREPIKQRAEVFRKELLAAEPKQLEAVVSFAAKAWRRSLSRSEQDELRALYRKLRTQELPHETAIRMTLARVFVAPAFLYKFEQPAPGKKQSPVSDTELATRLSYFLWSSAPDAELAALAAAGKLRDPTVLAAQTRRMLRDPRVRRLAVEFGAQWLHTRDLDKLDEKSERHFPTFTAVRGALNEEPIRFFTDLFQRDGSVLALLDADYTFVNAALAKHYGIVARHSNVESGNRNPTIPKLDIGMSSYDGWWRVEGVRAQGRGGVLGFGATLAKQSGASRTSPILRGNWLSETLLGERLPRPPKGVPVLPEEAPAGLTERALIERHSGDPKCASCHARIDPFGFALERYDAIGRLRAKDAAGLAIDSRTRTADGTELDGLDGLRTYLLTTRREAFERQFCRKLLGFALGRGVQLSDQPLLDEMLKQLAANEHRVGTVVEMIVRSRQFREIRGREMSANE
ncbi:MAG: hypothetical protein FD161_3381 [Limisphaerales bacterium]|nr:MAG: hypothetical protein FD161_3381 [Limisphaerales bacterium]KAG0507806.1 MAG: hypothetical protein E1N63_3047 [Limisphaerales bacterium]TXT48809.1 MAG: hypothetical protein FD140_3475 [Limisphaerales bacterium]